MATVVTADFVGAVDVDVVAEGAAVVVVVAVAPTVVAAVAVVVIAAVVGGYTCSSNGTLVDAAVCYLRRSSTS